MDTSLIVSTLHLTGAGLAITGALLNFRQITKLKALQRQHIAQIKALQAENLRELFIIEQRKRYIDPQRDHLAQRLMD